MGSVSKTYSGPTNTLITMGPGGTVPVLGAPSGGQPGIFLIGSYELQGSVAKLGVPVGLTGNRSGTTWIPEAAGVGTPGRLYVLANNLARMFECDPDNPGVVTRTVLLHTGGDSDTEGVCYHAATNELFVCTETGGGYNIRIYDWVKGVGDLTIYAKQVLTISAVGNGNNSGNEGIAFRPDLGANGVIYTVGEGQQVGTPRRILRTLRPTNTTTNYTYTDPELVVTEILNADTRITGSGATLDFSDCLLAPNNDLLIMSHQGAKIFQLDIEDLFSNHNTSPTHDAESITFKSELALPSGYQWEGMTFYGSGNDLFLVSEPEDYIFAKAPVLPVIAPMSDVQIQFGSTLQFTPTLTSGANVFWSLVYAHDDVTIDPETGQITWAVFTKGQGAYIGIMAYNNLGYDIAWRRVIINGNGGEINVIYCGHGTQYPTIKEGIAQALSGEVVIIKNGEYSSCESAARSLENGFQYDDGLPAGQPFQLTTIMAEVPGGVSISGITGFGTPAAPVDKIFEQIGNHPMTLPQLSASLIDLNNNPQNYIKYLGIIAGDVNDHGFEAANCHHVMYELCGSHGGDYAFNPTTELEAANTGSTASRIQNCEDVLVESCFDWGGGNRYHWQFKEVDRGIHRRCVGRGDHYYGDEPKGGWAGYTCVRYLDQDNIVIDGDSNFWPYHKNWAGCSSHPATGQESVPFEIESIGMISVNNDLLATTIAGDNATASPHLFTNAAIVNSTWYKAPHTLGAYYAGVSHTTKSTTHNNITVINARRGGNAPINADDAWFYGRSSSSNTSLSNSILYRLGYDFSTNQQFDPAALVRAGGGTYTLKYNCIYPMPSIVNLGFASAPTNTSTTDPTTIGLKYPVRIEKGATLQNSGEAGARQGAKCDFYNGKSWTFHGETGYNTPTTKRRFPIPIESIVYDNFRKYAKTGPKKGGGNGTLDGKRGACADDENLSYYIWSKLGNTVPPLNTASKGKSGLAVLYWQKPPKRYGSNITGFEIVRNSVVIATVGPNEYIYQDTIAPGTYTYNIRSIDSVTGTSGDSYDEVVTVL